MTVQQSQDSPVSQHAFLVGAQKCGTTALAYLLAQHPQVSLSTPKETNYFSSEFYKGLTWYLSSFSSWTDQVRLDASVSYSMNSIVQMKESDPLGDIPKRIFDHCPNARFIYILRNHADRVHSAYWHNVRGREESLPLREAFYVTDEYIAPSLYATQLDYFLRYFDRSQFLILTMDELSEGAVRTAKKCCDFLNLDRDFEFLIEPARNQSFQYSRIGNAIRSLAGSREGMKRATRFAKAVVPEKWWGKIRTLASRPIPPLTESDRKWLDGHFLDDRMRIREEQGIDV